MEPTTKVEGHPGDGLTETTLPPAPAEPEEPVPAPEKVALSKRLELVGALVTAVVALEFIALIVGVSGGGPYHSVGDRIELVSLNLDAKMSLLLLVAGMIVTLRDVASADFATPRSDLGRRTLMAIAVLGILIAFLSLIGIGLDISRTGSTSFGTNAGAAVIHRLAIVLMAAIAAGWSLAALGVRITTRRD
jgi:hypothetical protein